MHPLLQLILQKRQVSSTEEFVAEPCRIFSSGPETDILENYIGGTVA